MGGRAPEHDGFPAKLVLALGRANLSRAHVAQEVGVDKSVVARWVSGQVRPTEHNLVALTQVLARRAAPDFTLSDWRLPEAEFAARLGRPLPSPAANGAGGTSTAAARPNGGADAGLLANAAAWAAPGYDRALATYGGLWLFLYDSVRVRRSFAMVCEVRPGAATGALDVEVRDDENWRGRGPGFALHGKLWLVLEEVERRDSFGFALFWGASSGRAEVLDGLGMVREFAPSASPGATHVTAFRLADPLADAAANARRFEAAVRRVSALNAGGWEEVLPDALAERLPQSVTAIATTLRLGVENSLAINDFDLKAAEPTEGGPRRAALSLLRGLFAEALRPAPGP